MIQAVKEFFRDWLRLLYWVFMKPTALREHIQQIAGEQSNERFSAREFLRFCRNNGELRNFLLRALVFTFLTWLFCTLLADQLAPVLGYKYIMGLSLFGFVLFVAGGVGLGVGFGVAGRVAVGVEFGVGFGVAGGVGVGVAFGVAFGVAVGVAFGAGVGVAFGVAFGVAVSIAFGIGVGVAFGIAGGVGATRLFIYIFEIWPAINAYHRSLKSNHPEKYLLNSPIYFDELMVWPQPYLSSLLLRTIRANDDAGLRFLGKVACMPFQRWAAQKALRVLLEEERRPFFFNLHCLLTSPEPYKPIGFDLDEQARAADPYFTTKLLLAELMEAWPIPKREAYRVWPSDLLPRAMTFWLRKRGQSPYASIAKAYFNLLLAAGKWNDGRIWDKAIWDEATWDDDGKIDNLDDLFLAAGQSVTSLADLREYLHGEEFFQTTRSTTEARQCDSLQCVARFRNEFTPLFEIEKPLRPQIVAVFRRLRDATVDAASFLTAAHEITRRDALLKAQGMLEEARQLASNVYEPERSLLLAVIEHWRRIFAIEGGRVAERQEVITLPNPYVAGRPIRPEDGRLFAGRRDEMKLIEEKLQTGVGIVIWGQRRIGKTSILLHLRERLPHDLLPVYLNLQMLMANTTGGFLRAVGNQIVKELRDKFHVRSSAFRRQDSDDGTLPPEGGTTNVLSDALLSAEEFNCEPYLSFNHLLEEVERLLQPGQRVLLSFDEFEELEQRVKDGKIEKEIFAYLRGVTQTGRGFSLMFAGLHTLEQMTREYWNPFFQSVQTIRIGYLSELDAEQLIRDPIEQFPLDHELEAVNRITEVTRSHPYLTQSLCHNLINRLNDPLHRSQNATREDVDAVLEKTLESSGYYFDDYVWGWSGADEQLTLALLAEAGEEAAFSVVEKHLWREAALEATRKLVSREILTERTAAGELVFRFQIPLARMWVQRTKSSARLLLERSI